MKLKRTKKPYKVEVQENGTNRWIANQLRYETIGEATEAGRELFSRWFGIQSFRIVVDETGEVVG
jgi:hypothetical protein